MSQFPEDEFDRLGRERRASGVAGAHRKLPTNKPWWIALVAVLIIAPLLGWGIVQAMTNRGPSASPEPAASASVAAGDDAAANGAPSESAPSAPAEAPAPAEQSAEVPAPAPATTEAPAASSPAPAPTPEAAQADKGLTVLVLNATGRTGYAAQVQSQLKADGWASIAIGTYKHARPAASQIFYSSEAHQAEAKALGEKLGISQLILNAAATGDYPVVVVLAQ